MGWFVPAYHMMCFAVPAETAAPTSQESVVTEENVVPPSSDTPNPTLEVPPVSE